MGVNIITSPTQTAEDMKIAIATLLVVALVRAATIPRGATLTPLQRLKRSIDSIKELVAADLRGLSDSLQVSDGLLGAAGDGDDPGSACSDAAALLNQQDFTDCQETFSGFIGTYHPDEGDITSFCTGSCNAKLHDVFAQVAESCNNTEVYIPAS